MYQKIMNIWRYCQITTGKSDYRKSRGREKNENTLQENLYLAHRPAIKK